MGASKTGGPCPHETISVGVDSRFSSSSFAGEGALKQIVRSTKLFHTVGGRNPAPRKKPENDDSPARNGFPWFQSDAGFCPSTVVCVAQVWTKTWATHSNISEAPWGRGHGRSSTRWSQGQIRPGESFPRQKAPRARHRTDAYMIHTMYVDYTYIYIYI